MKERYIRRLKDIQVDSDTESGHIEADKVLCELLEELGFSEVVKEWDKVRKWYA